MAQTVKRLSTGSETWKNANACSAAEIEFLVLDPTSKQAAIQAVIQAAPTTYGGLPFKEVRFDGFDQGGNISCSVVYAESDDGGGGSDTDDDQRTTVNFNCSATTLHRVNAISQKCVYAGEGEQAESEADASAVPIGWNGKNDSESEAAGVDVSIGKITETYTKWMKIKNINKRKIAALVGKVNSGSFNGWEAGECMFMGLTYAAPVRGSEKVQVSFNFDIQLNENNAKVGGKNCGKKEGFEYLWALTNDKVESGKSKRKIKKIYKAVVCEKDGFGALGL